MFFQKNILLEREKGHTLFKKRDHPKLKIKLKLMRVVARRITHGIPRNKNNKKNDVNNS